MTQLQLKIQKPALRVSHQSEVLLLQRQLAEMQARIVELQKFQQQVIGNQETQIESSSRISLPIDGVHQFVEVDAILYCEAMGNYTRIYFDEQANQGALPPFILLSKTLKSVSQQIGRDDLFIRCHQSYLINKNQVQGYSKKDGFFVKLGNGQLISVSRRNKKKVMDACGMG